VLDKVLNAGKPRGYPGVCAARGRRKPGIQFLDLRLRSELTVEEKRSNELGEWSDQAHSTSL
jgi:hypothetical protein